MVSPSTVVDQPQATEGSSRKHAACDVCRGRKLKCSGDTPECFRCRTHNLVCHYSDQKPMGRPRKRRRSNPNEEQELQGSHSNLMDEISDPWTLTGDTIEINDGSLEATSWHFMGNSPLRSSVEPVNELFSISTPKPMPDIDFSDWQPPDLSVPSPLDPNYISPQYLNSPIQTTTTPLTPQISTCTCLSNLYSTLASFQTLPPPLFPITLAPLRAATTTARSAVNCGHCPTCFTDALQNTMLLGTLFPLIIDFYRKLLHSIDTEALKGGPKKFRIGEDSPETAHLHTGTPDCPMGIEIELAPDDWRRMARKVIRRDILGKEDRSSSDPGMLGLIQDMEKRQHTWHEKRSEALRNGSQCLSLEVAPRQAEGEHLCLKIVGLARAGITGLDLDPGGVAGMGSKGAETAAEEVVVAAAAAVPSRQKVQFSDNMNRWPFANINF